MKRFALILTLAALPAFWLMHAQVVKPGGTGGTQVLVPQGKTYAKLDANGDVIASYTSGQTMAVETDCLKINCPSSFAKDWVCWECKSAGSDAQKKE